MTWICKGRTVTSDDGRFRIAHVVREWLLYDRGVLVAWFPDAQSAIAFAGRLVQVKQRRRAS